MEKGIVIRGGIELGYIYQDAFMVFGEGLLGAYKLESEKAKVPRILIGEKALTQSVKRYDEKFDQQIENSVLYNYSEEEKSKIYDSYYSSSAKGPVVKDKELYYIDYLYDNLEFLFPRDETKYNNLKETILKGLEHENKSVKEKYKWLKDEYNWAIHRCIANLKETDKNKERIRRLENKLRIV